MKPQTKEILIHIWDSIKWYLLVILATAICMANCNGCKPSVKVVTPNHDSIYHAETIDNNTIELTLKHNNYLKRINDSLMASKPIVVIRIKTKFDSLYIADTSCQNSLIALYNSFGELNDLNDSIIANSQKRLINDSIMIATLTHKVGLKQSRIVIDSTRIVQLTDTIKVVKRKALWKGRGQGAAAYAIIREGVGTAAKFVP